MSSLLLEGVVLRIEADLTWLDACERAWGGAPMSAAVRVVGLAKHYGRGEALIRAVDDVDLEVADRRVRGGRGPERVRQVHAPAADGRPRPADLRRGLGRRPSGSTAPPSGRGRGFAATMSASSSRTST